MHPESDEHLSVQATGGHWNKVLPHPLPPASRGVSKRSVNFSISQQGNRILCLQHLEQILLIQCRPKALGRDTALARLVAEQYPKSAPRGACWTGKLWS